MGEAGMAGMTGMKVKLEDLSPVKKQLSVEVPADEVDRALAEVAREYGRQARIPGFRPGRVPVSVVRSRFAKEIEQDARERVVSRSFAQAAKESGLRPLGEPALDEVEHRAGEPLSFRTTFEVLPEFEPRGYKGIEVRRQEVGVTDEEIQRGLESLRQSRARLVVDEGRRAAAGDVVFADIEGRPAEGEPFRREHAPIEIGAEDNLPAFNERLTGAAAGDRVEFEVDYPEDFPAAPLAGKKVAYVLEVREVKRRDVPALDDDFAKDLGEFDDLAALRAKVGEDLLAHKRREADKAVRQAVLDKVLLENPIVLPDVLVEQEVLHRMEDIVRAMMLRGVDPEKSRIDWVDLRQRQEEPARKSVHARLLLDAVARVEQVRVDDAAIEQRIREDAERLGESPQKLRQDLERNRGREFLATQMTRERSLDYLTTVANIQQRGEV
jgi:trigger factor